MSHLPPPDSMVKRSRLPREVVKLDQEGEKKGKKTVGFYQTNLETILGTDQRGMYIHY